MKWWAGKSDEGIVAMFRVKDIDYVQQHKNGVAVFLKSGLHFITETYDIDGFAVHVLGDSDTLNFIRDED